MSNNSDLTEAQKLLLQKFPDLPEDDPLVAFATWNASLEEKVDNFAENLNIWTQAILKQTDLASRQNDMIVSQNLILQQTGKTNESLGQTLSELRQGLSELQKESELLRNAISGQERTLNSLNLQRQTLDKELKGLNQKMDSLETFKFINSSIDGLADNFRKLTISVKAQSKILNYNSWFVCSVLGILLILMVGVFFEPFLGFGH